MPLTADYIQSALGTAPTDPTAAQDPSLVDPATMDPALLQTDPTGDLAMLESNVNTVQSGAGGAAMPASYLYTTATSNLPQSSLSSVGSNFASYIASTIGQPAPSPTLPEHMVVGDTTPISPDHANSGSITDTLNNVASGAPAQPGQPKSLLAKIFGLPGVKQATGLLAKGEQTRIGQDITGLLNKLMIGKHLLDRATRYSETQTALGGIATKNGLSPAEQAWLRGQAPGPKATFGQIVAEELTGQHRGVDSTGKMNPGSTPFHLISGTVDAVAAMATDPLSVLGDIAKGLQVARRAPESADAVDGLINNARTVTAAKVLAKMDDAGRIKRLSRAYGWGLSDATIQDVAAAKTTDDVLGALKAHALMEGQASMRMMPMFYQNAALRQVSRIHEWQMPSFSTSQGAGTKFASLLAAPVKAVSRIVPSDVIHLLSPDASSAFSDVVDTWLPHLDQAARDQRVGEFINASMGAKGDVVEKTIDDGLRHLGYSDQEIAAIHEQGLKVGDPKVFGPLGEDKPQLVSQLENTVRLPDYRTYLDLKAQKMEGIVGRVARGGLKADEIGYGFTRRVNPLWLAHPAWMFKVGMDETLATLARSGIAPMDWAKEVAASFIRDWTHDPHGVSKAVGEAWQSAWDHITNLPGLAGLKIPDTLPEGVSTPEHLLMGAHGSHMNGWLDVTGAPTSEAVKAERKAAADEAAKLMAGATGRPPRVVPGGWKVVDQTEQPVNYGISYSQIVNHQLRNDPVANAFIHHATTQDALADLEHTYFARAPDQVVEATAADIPKADYYHGTSRPLPGHQLDPDRYMAGSGAANLFGPGTYVTNDPRVALSYTDKGAKTVSGEGKTIYGIRWKGSMPPKLIDLSKPLPADVHDTFLRFFEHNPGDPYVGEDLTQLARDLQTKPGDEIYRELRQAMADGGIPRTEADEHLEDLHAALGQKGYDGFQYQGGKYTKSQIQHEATVFFDPGKLETTQAIPKSKTIPGERYVTKAGKERLTDLAIAPKKRDPASWVKAMEDHISTTGKLVNDMLPGSMRHLAAVGPIGFDDIKAAQEAGQLPQKIWGFNFKLAPKEAKGMGGAYQHVVDNVFGPMGHFLDNSVRKPLWNSLYRQEYGRLSAIADSAGWPLDEELASKSAATFATDRLMGTIHNPAQKTAFDIYTRSFLPFNFAKIQSIKRWGRVLQENPSFLRTMHLFNDSFSQDGVFHKDSFGNSVFSVPVPSEFLQAFLTFKLGTADETPGALGPLNMFTKAIAPPMMPFDGNVMPGFGAALTLPVAAIVSRRPDVNAVRQAILGPGFAQASYQGMSAANRALQAVAPAWISNLSRAAHANPADASYANAFKDAMSWAIFNGKNPEDPATKKAIMAQAREMYLVRAASSLFSPYSQTPDFEGMAPVKELRALQAANGNTVGTHLFLQKYGDRGVGYTIGKTAAVKKDLFPTPAAEQFYQDNQDLYNAYPNTAGYFAPQDTFDPKVIATQVANGERKTLTPDEWIAKIMIPAGNAMYYNQVKPLIDVLRAQHRPARVVNAIEQQKLKEIDTLHPGWLAYHNQGSTRAAQRTADIEELQRAAADPRLADNQAAASAREFAALFNSLSAVAAARGNKSLTATKNAALRAILIAKGRELVASDPDFAAQWTYLWEPELGVSDAAVAGTPAALPGPPVAGAA